MTRTLIKNADVIATMGQAGEILNADILIENGVVREVGQNISSAGCEVHHAEGCVITPGLINTHHHLYQTLTRAVPAAQDALLFDWLKVLYPIWGRMGPDDIKVSAMTGLAELALSGCTMSSDHLYMYPNGARLDDSIEAAVDVGIRFAPTRGSMSIGESDGGLPPDALVEVEANILKDSQRVIDAFHDPSEGSMINVGLAPCSPFSVSRELMRDSALMAREYQVRLHTHLAENQQDIDYSLANFGCRPGQYAEELGWVGDDVWHAHCVMLDHDETSLFARTGTGIAHCPCSNARLGSGIAPVGNLLKSGVKVGLGVDGSASNDAGNLILEARQAMLLQRVKNGADAMSARATLRLATKGGAEVLGRPDLGELSPGKRADLAIWDVSGLEAAGAWDPIAALMLSGPTQVRDLYVEGRAVVSGGNLNSFDTRAHAARHNAHMKRLME